MLPAISSDLPAYLLPPRVGEEDRRTTPDDFGPAARVDISAEAAIDAQSAQPGTGLYGPDGQFVDAAARRESQNQTQPDGAQSQPAADQPSSNAAGVPELSQDQAVETPPVISSQTASVQRDRDIVLDNYDAIIPPAAREELRDLADRIGRKSSEQGLSSDEYKKMAELMMRVGRHSDAMWALTEADRLEQAGQSAAQSEPPSDAPSSMLSTAGVA